MIAALRERAEAGPPGPVHIEDLDGFLDHWLEELRARGAVGAEATRPAGADDATLRVAEARLGVQLPPDYARFLRAANGWPGSSEETPGLRPIEGVDWFRASHQDWIDIYLRSADPGEEWDAEWNRELSGALLISDEGDGVVFLLNPCVADPEGNWEPWIFGNWVPGEDRFRSFAELLSYMRDDEDDEA